MRVCLNGNASDTSIDTDRGLECLAHQGELQSQVDIGVKQPRKLLTLPASAQSSNRISPSFRPPSLGSAESRLDRTKVSDPFTAKLSLLVKQDNCHIKYSELTGPRKRWIRNCYYVVPIGYRQGGLINPIIRGVQRPAVVVQDPSQSFQEKWAECTSSLCRRFDFREARIGNPTPPGSVL